MGIKGMNNNKNISKDCLGLRLRVNGLHQTWKWLHQTIALHNYLISVSLVDRTTKQQAFENF